MKKKNVNNVLTMLLTSKQNESSAKKSYLVQLLRCTEFYHYVWRKVEAVRNGTSNSMTKPISNGKLEQILNKLAPHFLDINLLIIEILLEDLEVNIITSVFLSPGLDGITYSMIYNLLKSNSNKYEYSEATNSFQRKNWSSHSSIAMIP